LDSHHFPHSALWFRLDGYNYTHQPIPYSYAPSHSPWPSIELLPPQSPWPIPAAMTHGATLANNITNTFLNTTVHLRLQQQHQ
jgi:hypothetical protein